ncbi:hypothetical protein GW17_00023390 [Ensete ventricosum]|nr:hypothetical protein GW17_00023390 [Ensete ventricosum]
MRWELAERLTGSLPKVSEACWEFSKSLSKGSEACREFAGRLPKVSEACWEFVGSLPGWRREFAGRRPRDSQEDRWGLSKSLSRVMRVLLDLMVT